MYWIIKRYRGWAPTREPLRLVGVFRYRWTARLYRWWHYGFAEPIWQGSFAWDIVESQRAVAIMEPDEQ